MRTKARGSARWGVGLLAIATALTACAKSSTPASGSSGTGGVTVKSATVSNLGSILTDSRGFTLYLLTAEKGDKIACTGLCASQWPPLKARSGSVSGGGGVTASKLGTVTLPSGGKEVTYNGWPLHTYSGDSAAGQANGQGIQNVWFAVTASGTAAAGSSGGGSSPSSSGGGRYGY